MSEAFHELFSHVLRGGHEISPRGKRTLELAPYVIKFYQDADVWCNFPARKLNPKYTAREFLWYLHADPEDTSIAQYAPIWRSLVSQGVLQSNYGVYLFRDAQLLRCREELLRDPDSRRASVVILQPQHYRTASADIPCTYSLNFRILEGRLCMHVHMRSNDAWFGAGNDFPIFRWTQHLLADMLSRPVGRYVHITDSMHLYEEHWGPARQCLTEKSAPITHPPITNAYEMITAIMRDKDADPVCDFHAWLKEMTRA